MRDAVERADDGTGREAGCWLLWCGVDMLETEGCAEEGTREVKTEGRKSKLGAKHNGGSDGRALYGQGESVLSLSSPGLQRKMRIAPTRPRSQFPPSTRKEAPESLSVSSMPS